MKNIIIILSLICLLFAIPAKGYSKVKLTKDTATFRLFMAGDERFLEGFINYYCPADSIQRVLHLNSATSGRYNIQTGLFMPNPNIAQVTVNENHPHFTIVSRVLFNKDKTILIAYLAGKKSDEYVIPNSVTAIGTGAFRNSYLSNIIIPSSVITIGRSAFEVSNISNITLPNSITAIRRYAFRGSRNLTQINIPDSLKFIECEVFAGTALTSIELPNSIRGMGNRVLANNSNLEKISVFWQNPEAVSISRNTFRDTNIRNITLEVPFGTKDRYLALEPWKHFNIVERKE